MAYTPNIWVDREGTTRYFETVEKDGAKIFTPDYSQLTEIGTPVNADNMNHIEEGIAAGSFTKYDSNTVYQINDLVTSFEGSELKVYKSLKSENYNNPVADTTYWEEVALGGGGSGFNLFATQISDHILEGDEALGWALQGTYVYKNGVAGSRTGYADFYNKCLAEKEQGTSTETTLGDNTITMYVNGNGHKFYDIADKDVVDTFYNAIGIADFYGVDTANERIFLPRNDKFIQLTGDVNNVNNTIEAGLPNIEDFGSITIHGLNSSSVYDDKGTFTGYVWSGSNATGRYAAFNASKSNPIYGNSDTVQPPSSLKLLYYCVGNTKVESAISNVTEITTSENDTLPLFYNFYSNEDMTTTGAYVNASLGSWLSGNVYITAYNELVNKLGTGNVKANTDTYTDYDFVVNQDDMTFRLPLLNGSEDLPSDRYTSGTVSNGMIYTAPANGWVNVFGVGLPNVSNQIFLYLSNNGEDALTSPKVKCIYAEGTTGTSAGLEVQRGDKVGILSENVQFSYASYTNLGISFNYAKGNGNLYYKLSNAVTNLELLDAGEVMAEVNNAIKKTECPAYIVETYQNGESWYRVYSDGWCEQGGYVDIGGQVTTTITLLKPYKDTNYNITRCLNSDYDSPIYGGHVGVRKGTQTSTSFGFYHLDIFPSWWKAEGYIR